MDSGALWRILRLGGHAGGSSIPALPAGQYYLVDVEGNYILDVEGNYIVVLG